MTGTHHHPFKAHRSILDHVGRTGIRLKVLVTCPVSQNHVSLSATQTGKFQHFLLQKAVSDTKKMPQLYFLYTVIGCDGCPNRRPHYLIRVTAATTLNSTMACI